MSFMKARSIFVSWIKSYIFLLAIIVGINIAVYSQTQRTIRNEIHRTNEVMLNQTQQSIDTALESIDTLMFQISMNSNYRRIAIWTEKDINNILFSPEYESIVKAMKNLGELKNVNAFVNEMYIYLNNSDKILSTMGLSNPGIFYNASKESPTYYEVMPFDEWYKNLRNIHAKKYIVQRENEEWGNGDNYSVKMMQTLPLIAKGNSDATLVFILNREKFMNVLNSISSMYNGWTLILDREGQALFSNIPNTDRWKPDYDALSQKSGMVYGRIDGEKVVVSYIKSQISDWKYVSVLPYSLFSEKLIYTRNLIFIGILLSAVIGVLLAYYFSRSNYYPVDDLVKIIKRRYGESKSAQFDEFHLIRDAVTSTIDENQRIRRSLKEQNAKLRANFIYRLIKGKIENISFIENAFRTYDLNFCSDYFSVVLFYITDIDALFEDTDNMPYGEKLEFVQFIIANVTTELISQNNPSYMLEIDDMMTCLINFREANLSQGEQEIIRIVDEAISFISGKFNIKLRVAASKIGKGIFAIPKAYEEALDVMEYKTVMEDDRILFSEDIKDPRYNYHYSMEDEYQMINYIRVGSEEEAKNIMNKVFERTISESKLSIDIIKCLMFDLASTIFKAMNETDATDRIGLLNSMNFPSRLLTSETVTDMRHYMNWVLDKVCDYNSQSRNDATKEQIDDVIRHIKDNYTDINFSVSSIAEEFGITPSYLTRLFKEYTGKGVLEYISDCRIGKAKELLLREKLKIKDISAAVGYFNINAFNRMFKKYEGVTPSVYRDNMK